MLVEYINTCIYIYYAKYLLAPYAAVAVAIAANTAFRHMIVALTLYASLVGVIRRLPPTCMWHATYTYTKQINAEVQLRHENGMKIIT